MASDSDGQRPLDLKDYQDPNSEFVQRSLRELLEARDLYHALLARHPNVVATAIGRYRIRKTDDWPKREGEARPKKNRKEKVGKGERTLGNSEVRPYSWPCILVFVSKWEDPADFASRPWEMVPKFLFLPDGRRIPLCVIAAPREDKPKAAPRDVLLPLNNIGPGRPVVAKVQLKKYVATVGCLVSDGHKIFALTNRHVAGDVGEVVYAQSGSADARIGVSSAKQLTRLPFTDVYPSLPGRNAFVKLDIGLIELDDVSRWTTKLPGLDAVGAMADFSDTNVSLSLVGCHVRGFGAASGETVGEILGLFYRYRSSGGFEYIADLLIGPRDELPFETLPGDSGALWLLEPRLDDRKRKTRAEDYRPLALQWGRNMLQSTQGAEPQGFALATLLSRACALLDVDVVRDWNVDQPNTWAALGHFAIAARGREPLSDRVPNLKTLMEANAEIVSRSEGDLGVGKFTGMGSAAFVPMADVPDFFWKQGVAKQGHARSLEGPNHFADMDQPNAAGQTLLSLSEDPDFLDPDKWDAFYGELKDLKSGKKISATHRGLLPFRCWQIFDAMVEHVRAGDRERFVCAAGVLTHYVGDACQPLHASYLHDGDPKRRATRTITQGKRAGEQETETFGEGVHSAYEDKLIFRNRTKILKKLFDAPTVRAEELIGSGRDAAMLIVDLMRRVSLRIPPMSIVEAHAAGTSPEKLWELFGDATIEVMKDGTHTVAVLWESAWTAGDGERTIERLDEIAPDDAMAIVADKTFLPSTTINRIGPLLKQPVAHVAA